MEMKYTKLSRRMCMKILWTPWTPWRPSWSNRLDHFGFEPNGGEIRLGDGHFKWGFCQRNLKQGESQTYQTS
jgi:hypothetical protein